MIDLAICMTLQNEGYGTYGQNLFFGTSPVLDTGLREHKNQLHPNTTHYLERAATTANNKIKTYFNL